MLAPAFIMRPGVATFHSTHQDHEIPQRLDSRILPQLQAALIAPSPIVIERKILNTDRSVGALMSNFVSKRFVVR